MDSISPLAKILAEANGIDWRSIPGSGDSGTIVEQDILNYLSRIMSGDEEPPATPVDEAPPGWTGQMPPMPVMGSAGLQALSAAGVESDITDFVAQNSEVKIEPVRMEPVQAASAVVETPAAPEVAVSEERVPEETVPEENVEFELDESEAQEAAEPELAPAAVAAPEVPTPAVQVPPVQVQLPELQPAAPQVAARAEVAAPQEAAQPAAGFGLGGFLSRLYRKPASDPVPSQPAALLPQANTPALPDPLIGAAHAVPSVAATPAQPVVAAQATQPAQTTPIEVDAVDIDPVELDHGQHVAADGVTAGGDLGSFVPESETQPESQEVAAVADHVAPAQIDTVPAQVAVVPAPVQPAPVVQPAAQRAPRPMSVPSAPSAGVSLRLNADVAALVAAQSQLSDALGQAVPLSLLVGRAAARCMGTLGLAGVSLADASGQALAADLSGDFRTSLANLSAHGDAGQNLLVLDAAELGLDELHLGERSLSVGRSDDGRAVLSLRGNIDARSGASFLHEVAALLETPIKLLF